jgi:hypothetical protein
MCYLTPCSCCLCYSEFHHLLFIFILLSFNPSKPSGLTKYPAKFSANILHFTHTLMIHDTYNKQTLFSHTAFFDLSF